MSADEHRVGSVGFWHVPREVSIDKFRATLRTVLAPLGTKSVPAEHAAPLSTAAFYDARRRQILAGEHRAATSRVVWRCSVFFWGSQHHALEGARISFWKAGGPG